MWNRSRAKWTARTFAPALFMLGVAVSYFVEGDADSGLLMLVLATSAAVMGFNSLSWYRAGYWRGCVESKDPAHEIRALIADWQPSPWDDNRW